ncbi:MAG: tRNA lysidine(34) synthetase TilS [Treponema sp.]|nr:tRNA lysidine(34) synthetase TilS [Treponema sp.]
MSKTDVVSEFEDSVYDGLKKCGISLDEKACTGLRLGAAVSGGADSVALLFSLAELCKKSGAGLFVISVNHFIRPDEETCGDFEFVRNLCERLYEQEFPVQFFPYELERGSVKVLAQEKCYGIEAAARELRYKAFESFINEQKLDALCLAHNQNDNFETILMRFLQGASASSSGGIPRTNGKIIRPLLDISREQIEQYLVAKNESWRTDKSNFDENYLRNKIRRRLIPFLNENFDGWKKALLSGAEKANDDAEVISGAVEEAESVLQKSRENNGSLCKKKSSSTCCDVKISGSVGDELKINRSTFDSLKKGVRIRVLLNAMNGLGVDERIPYQFLCDVTDCKSIHFEKTFRNIQICAEKENLFIKKTNKNSTDLNFFVIIEEKGKFEFPFGTLEVCEIENEVSVAVNGNIVLKKIELPFCVSSFRLDDTVPCADGSSKKIKDIYSDWRVPEKSKSIIPVIEELCNPEQNRKFIIGSVLGFKDWI